MGGISIMHPKFLTKGKIAKSSYIPSIFKMTDLYESKNDII